MNKGAGETKKDEKGTESASSYLEKAFLGRLSEEGRDVDRFNVGAESTLFYHLEEGPHGRILMDRDR